MRCRKTRSLLSLFLDGQLDERQTSKIKAHLDKCLACTKELNLLKTTWDLLGEWKKISPSPAFKANFWQKVFQQEPVVEKRPVFVFPRLKLRLVPAFATIAAILIVGIFLTHLASVRNLGQLTLATKAEDIVMLKELELTEDFEIVQSLNLLEDFPIIDSLEL